MFVCCCLFVFCFFNEYTIQCLSFTHMYVCMYVCVYVCMYVYTHTRYNFVFFCYGQILARHVRPRPTYVSGSKIFLVDR